MATVKLAPRALIKFQRITQYLIENSPDVQAAEKFARLIRSGLAELAENPFIAGFSTVGERYRELTLKANKTRAYRLLYKYDAEDNTVTILAIKDAREQGYEGYF